MSDVSYVHVLSSRRAGVSSGSTKLRQSEGVRPPEYSGEYQQGLILNSFEARLIRFPDKDMV